jgi:hypothetical protein
VHDAGPVRVLERGQHPVDHPHRSGRVERPLVDDVLEQAPLDELHHDERQLHLMTGGVGHRFLARVEHANDRGMRHARGRLRLLAEAHAERGVGGELRLQQLDGDLPSEARVGADVHVGHATPPDEGAHAVTSREHASFIVHGASVLVCLSVGFGVVRATVRW